MRIPWIFVILCAVLLPSGTQAQGIEGYNCYSYTTTERAAISLNPSNIQSVCENVPGRLFIGCAFDPPSTPIQNCRCSCIVRVVPAGCTLFNATERGTFAALAAVYLSTPYQIAIDNNLPLSNVTGSYFPGEWFVVCPEPGRRRVNSTNCLANVLQRPCRSFTGRAQRDCFCSYHGDGPWLWPFEPNPARNCSVLIYCSQGAAVNLTSCPANRFVVEEKGIFATSPGRAACLEANNSQPFGFCAGRCADTRCLCSEYLLPDGLYQDPYDAYATHAFTCKDAALETEVTCFFGKFDPSDGQCRAFPSVQCATLPDEEACAIVLAEPDEEDLCDLERLLNESGTDPFQATGGRRLTAAAPIVKRECNNRACCARYFRSWQANFERIGCLCPTCPNALPVLSPWIRPTRAPVGSGDCSCQYRGTCPSRIKTGCRAPFPACFRCPVPAIPFTIAGLRYCTPTGRC